MAAGAEEDKTRWPGYVAEAYPDMFINIPPQPSESKPGQLTKQQVEQFFDDGYLVVDKFFEEHELEACKDAINEKVEELAQKLFKAGKIKELYRDYGFYKRLTKIEEDFPGANIILHKIGHLPQAFRDLLANERMLNVLEQLLGTSDIMASPIWNLRTKTPQNEATVVPWHQDSAYFDTDSYKVMIATAWIPLLDANEKNGCLQMLRKGHRSGRVAMHQCCHGGTWYVMMDPDDIEPALEVDMEKDVITTPVPYGGMILFSNLLPHQSLPNMSEDIRWSMDLRWMRGDKSQGFWGLKDGVLLRSSKDPKHTPDWSTFDAVSRHDISYSLLGIKEEEFDTTIPGPWMKQWEIVHVNRHTEAQVAQDKSNKPAPTPIIVG